MRWTSPLLSLHQLVRPKPGPDFKPPPANGIVEDVDPAAFKSTFISKPKDKKKEMKNKKQKRSKVGALVSFDVDVDGGESLLLTVAHQKHQDRDIEGPRKKKQKRSTRRWR